MKKLILICTIFAGNFIFSQTTKLIINNYSSYQLKTRFGASGLAGNCHPTLDSNPYTGNSDLNILAASSPTSPFTVSYPNYPSPLTASVPFNRWFVRTNPAAAGSYRFTNDISLVPTGVIAQNTNWSYFSFQTHNGSGSSIDSLYLEVGNCGTTPIYSSTGTNSTAEWFTITSSGDTYTYVQIY